MANVWLGFATSHSAGRFAEGDALLIYDHAPNGEIENRIFAWFGPFDLTDEEIEMIRRTDVVRKRVRKAVVAAVGNKVVAYAIKAFDPTVYVPPSEIMTFSKRILMAVLEDR